MLNKKFFLSASRISIIVLLFWSTATLAAVDPLEQLEQDVDQLALEITSQPANKQCRSMYGDRLQFWFRSEFIDVESFVLSDLELRVSRCYSERMTHIDKILQRDIIDKFRVSTLACDEKAYDLTIKKIQEIMDRRKNMFALLHKTKDYSKEYCEGDPGKYTFEETQKALIKLKKNWEIITTAIASLSNEGKKSNLWKKYSWQVDQEKINERAKIRAQKFTDDFNKVLTIGGIFRERTVADNLKSLPEGKSIFYELKKAFTSSQLLPTVQEKQGKKLSTYLKKSNATKTTLMFLETQRLNDIQSNIRRFEKDFGNFKRSQEKQSEFNEALTNAIIVSLKPFHETTKETKKHMGEITKSLESVLHRQNVGQ